MAAPPTSSIEQQVRKAIENALEARGWTRYKLAKEAKVAYPVLLRFLDDHTDIRLSTLSALLEAIDYCVCPVANRKRK